MRDILNSNSMKIAEKSLDSLWMKQQVLSNNIANIDTPGYKCKTVEFEELLKDVLMSQPDDTLLQERLSTLRPEVVENDSTSMREDGNNVDIDAENIELVRTQLQYEYMISMLSGEISRMKYAINGGGN